MNVLEKIPAKVRVALYLVYAVAGPVLVYTAARGWTGENEYTLYVGLGTALGLTAAANVRTRIRLRAEDVPHTTYRRGYGSGVSQPAKDDV